MDCGRPLVECVEQYLISDTTRVLIERLLVERISLRGIGRAVGVGLKWLSDFIITCSAALPKHLHVQPVPCNHATIDTDQYVVYEGMIPTAQHRAISKLARKTNRI